MRAFDKILEKDESRKLPLVIKYMAFLLRHLLAISKRNDGKYNTYLQGRLLIQLLQVKDKLSSENSTLFSKYYYELLVLERQKDILYRGLTMLHYVCDTPHYQSQATDMAQFLINLGADVNAQDYLGNTPLHRTAVARPFNAKLVDLLVNNNAHIDMVNSSNKTPMDQQPTDTTAVSCLRQPVRHMSLQCLAARAVCKYNIQYNGNVLPEPCIAAIKQHIRYQTSN
jgi:ankyrin repeat protein